MRRKRISDTYVSKPDDKQTNEYCHQAHAQRDVCGEQYYSAIKIHYSAIKLRLQQPAQPSPELVALAPDAGALIGDIAGEGLSEERESCQ